MLRSNMCHLSLQGGAAKSSLWMYTGPRISILTVKKNVTRNPWHASMSSLPFSIYLLICSPLHRFPVAPLHKSAWPGGMCGAIESAALAVWQELACQIQSTSPKLISNLQISTPPQISPQRPRAFRPADPNRPWTWILSSSKNTSQCRARSKKLMPGRTW